MYNRKDKIHEAIQSVLNQHFSDWELIIADDGSTDGTAESLDRYSRDKRIKVIILPHNGNPGFVRNRAVEQSTGEWIAFLDSDDIWHEDKLNHQIEFFQNNRDILFVHTREVWSRNGVVVSQKHRKHRKEGDLFFTSLGKCEIGPSTVMMNRDLFLLLGGFREDLEICEDYELWLRVTDSYPVGYLDEPLIIKRGGHSDQLSQKYGQIEFFKIQALKGLVDKGIFHMNHQKFARKELSEKCRIYSLGCRKRGRINEAEEFEKLYFYYGNDDVQNNE